MNLKDYIRNQDPVWLILQLVFIPAAFFAAFIAAIIYFSDVKPVVLCEQKCYPNWAIGYSISKEKCVCDMSRQYRDVQ
jgi:hypothetical protein